MTAEPAKGGILVCLKTKKAPSGALLQLVGDVGFEPRCRIRTYDPLVPNQLRYRTALITDANLTDNSNSGCLVGDVGFEPTTHWSQTSCATGLR